MYLILAQDSGHLLTIGRDAAAEIREGRILASSLGVLQILLFVAFQQRQISLGFRTTFQAFELAPIRDDVSIFDIY